MLRKRFFSSKEKVSSFLKDIRTSEVHSGGIEKSNSIASVGQARHSLTRWFMKVLHKDQSTLLDSRLEPDQTTMEELTGVKIPRLLWWTLFLSGAVMGVAAVEFLWVPLRDSQKQ
jgi:hypothetical protein